MGKGALITPPFRRAGALIVPRRDGSLVLDIDNAEALLVRKDGDAGDIFLVDTVNSRVGVGGAPLARTHVQRGADGAALTGAQAGTADFIIENRADNTNLRSIYAVNRAAGAIQSVDLEFWMNAFGGNMGDAAKIRISNVQGTGAGATSSTIRFFTTNDQAAPVERVTINPQGQITVTPGVAATAPFVIGANGTGVLVSGLNAELVGGNLETAFALLAGRAGTANNFTISTDGTGIVRGSAAAAQGLDLVATSHVTDGPIRFFTDPTIQRLAILGTGVSLFSASVTPSANFPARVSILKAFAEGVGYDFTISDYDNNDLSSFSIVAANMPANFGPYIQFSKDIGGNQKRIGYLRFMNGSGAASFFDELSGGTLSDAPLILLPSNIGGAAPAVSLWAAGSTQATAAIGVLTGTDPANTNMLVMHRSGGEFRFGVEKEGTGVYADLILRASGATAGKIKTTGNLEWVNSILLGPVGAPDVELSRGAANRLDFAVGDSLFVPTTLFAGSGGVLYGTAGQLRAVVDSFGGATWAQIGGHNGAVFRGFTMSGDPAGQSAAFSTALFMSISSAGWSVVPSLVGDDGTLRITSAFGAAGFDAIALRTNATDRLTLYETEGVVNESGGNFDFRVEGDTEANLLFVDASTDRVGVGTATPTHRLEVRAPATDGEVIAANISNISNVSSNTKVAVILTPDFTGGTVKFVAGRFASGTDGGSLDIQTTRSGGGAYASSLAVDNTGQVTIAATLIVGGATAVGTRRQTIQSDLAKTSVTARTLLSLKSSETFGVGNPNVLEVVVTGAATQASRIWDMQTGESGVADGGRLRIQPNAGSLVIGGTTATVGFFGATPVAQGASVADAAGGATVDAEARAAINALISRIEATGLIATV